MIPMNADRLIREARTRAALTQRQLALRAGTSQAAIAAYERGTKQPQLPVLQRILAAAGFVLRTELAALPTPQAAALHATSNWRRRTTVEHGRTLVDLLLLVDYLPRRPAGELAFPPLKNVGNGQH